MLKRISWFTFLSVAIALLGWGMVRASSNKYADQRQSIYNRCGQERERLHLSDTELRQKYPTPEISLIRAVKVAPGGIAEVVVKGNFQPGTTFLFDNDRVQVVKEALTGSEYHATIKVSSNPLPDYANVYSFQPVRCLTTSALAIRIDGKFEWDLNADNGWRIKLESIPDPSAQPDRTASLYRGEFYRPGEAKPFQVRNVDLGCREDECHGVVGEGTEDAALKQKATQAYMNRSGPDQQQSQTRVKQLQDEMAQLTAKMKDYAKLSPSEQKTLMARMQEISNEMKDAMTPKAVAEAQQQIEKNQQEFGCAGMSLMLRNGALTGTVACGQNVGKQGRLSLTGNVKYLGP